MADNQQFNLQLKDHPDLKDLSDTLSDRVATYRNEQLESDLQALLNRDFLNCKQWQVLLENLIVEPPRDRGEVRLTDNFISPMVRAFAAELLGYDLEWNVRAVNADDRRISESELGRQLLKSWYIGFQRSLKLNRLVFGHLIDGISYVTPEFYPTAGRPIAVDPRTKQPIPQGIIGDRITSKLDVLVPGRFATLNDAPCVIEIVRMHPKDVQNRWHLPDEPPASVSDFTKKRWKDIYGKDTDVDKMVEVHKIWFKSGNGALVNTGEFPSGVGFVFIPDAQQTLEILPSFPAPFDDPRLASYPLIDFHFEPKHELYYSMGLPEIVMGLQMQHNRTISNIAQAINYIGMPVWRATKGQFSDENDIPTYAGGVMYYNPLQGIPAPDVVTMPPLAGHVTAFGEQMKAAAREVLSMSELANAQQPGAVNSYSGIAKLSEIQAKIFRPWTMRQEAKLSFLGKCHLMLEAKYTDVPKMLAIADDTGDMAIAWYRGSDLGSDFEVEVDLGVGETPATANQRMMQEIQMQIPGAIDNYQQKVYGLSGNKDYKQARAAALAENMSAMQGQSVDNTTLDHILGDNHKVHFEIKNSFIRSDEFKNLPPPVQQTELKHAAVHFLGMSKPDDLYQMYALPAMQQLGIAFPQPPPAPGQQPGQQQQSPAPPAPQPAQPPARGPQPQGAHNV